MLSTWHSNQESQGRIRCVFQRKPFDRPCQVQVPPLLNWWPVLANQLEYKVLSYANVHRIFVDTSTEDPEACSSIFGGVREVRVRYCANVLDCKNVSDHESCSNYTQISHQFDHKRRTISSDVPNIKSAAYFMISASLHGKSQMSSRTRFSYLSSIKCPSSILFVATAVISALGTRWQLSC